MRRLLQIEESQTKREKRARFA